MLGGSKLSGFLCRRTSQSLYYVNILQESPLKARRAGSNAKSDNRTLYSPQSIFLGWCSMNLLWETALKSPTSYWLCPGQRLRADVTWTSPFQGSFKCSGGWPYPPLCLPCSLFPHDSAMLHSFSGFFQSTVSQGSSLLATPKYLR